MDITALRKDLEQIVIESYSLKELNLLVSLEVQDKTAAVKLYKAALNTENRKYLSSLIADLAVKYGFKESQTEYIEKEPQYINHISKIIAVMSGKGGVGKSMAASLTAVALSRTGLRVGILDADITGPSIAKMFGINGRPPGNELGFLPLLSRSGISIISTNLLLDDEHSAVIWRGGMISKAISQFY
ncbi:MAG: P-loop NTPase, partial [Chloroflexi bacterium]|nr:P-loop NTPase [Chloroflexota bacterium]